MYVLMACVKWRNGLFNRVTMNCRKAVLHEVSGGGGDECGSCQFLLTVTVCHLEESFKKLQLRNTKVTNNRAMYNSWSVIFIRYVISYEFVIDGSLSPRHGASSVGGWRSGRRYGG
jgi:hypothetical protein